MVHITIIKIEKMSFTVSMLTRTKGETCLGVCASNSLKIFISPNEPAIAITNAIDCSVLIYADKSLNEKGLVFVMKLFKVPFIGSYKKTFFDKTPIVSEY